MTATWPRCAVYTFGHVQPTVYRPDGAEPPGRAVSDNDHRSQSTESSRPREPGPVRSARIQGPRIHEQKNPEVLNG